MCICHAHDLLPLFHSQVCVAMLGESDGQVIKPISADEAYELIQAMVCAVYLDPEFCTAAVARFTRAAKGTQHLLALTENGVSDPSGMILYSVGKGRKGKTKLSCILLFVRKKEMTHVARALIDHSISQHSASYMMATVIKSAP